MAQGSNNEIAELYDALGPFGGGMNSGVAAVLLDKHHIAFASNATVRGTYIRPRPPWQIYTLNFGGDAALTAAVVKGLWQQACYFRYDDGTRVLFASISGRLFEFKPAGTTAIVTERTGGNAQNAAATQAWLLQAEQFLIWNDGSSLPVFYNSNTFATARSNGNTQAPVPGVYHGNFTGAVSFLYADAINTTYTVPLTPAYTGLVNDIVFVWGTNAPRGEYLKVTDVTDPSNIVLTKYAQFVNNPGMNVQIGGGLSQVTAPAAAPHLSQLPAGRDLAYMQGRVIEALTDGQTFIYGDIVKGPSGTLANSFRDAVLNTTENLFIVGGGSFVIPGQFGSIRAFAESAGLDASLGQGPLQVLTPDHIFSCAVPTDRTTWQSVTNPILSVALIGRGATGQNSTVIVNSDTIFRQIDGIGSLILARRDFDTWGNVPISREVERIILKDAQNLLPWGTAAFFDNRLLMSSAPTAHTQGVYHQGLVALNADPISSIQGKAPSVYDGSWPGLNALQLVRGEFNSVDRCFAFTLDPAAGAIGLSELLASSTNQVLDNGTDRIVWWFEGPCIFKDPEGRRRQFKRLLNGEIFVDNMVGQVDFSVQYRPDDYPAWVQWASWSECAGNDTLSAAIAAANGTVLPQFRPRMGLGEPSPRDCDATTNRPFREGYYFQIKVIIQGWCRFKGARFMASPIPEPKFAPTSCKTICGNPFTAKT